MPTNANLELPTSAEDLQRTYIPHLRTQFERARPILFTGAGFSVTARNSSGETLPAYAALQEKLWDLCFPGEAFEARISNLIQTSRPSSGLERLYS